MDKNNKIFLIILTVCTIVIIGICAWSIMNHENKNKEILISDAVKFKTEYEKLNGLKNDYDKTYPTVSINENNTVKYITDAEASDIIENGTGVIYFGFSKCPWCRSMIGELVSAAKEANTTLYYLDVLDIRSTYEIKDKVLVKTKNGTEGYYKILSLLDNELKDFILTDEDKNEYKTGEKRLYAPTVVAVKDGNITSFHDGTLDSQEDPYIKLKESELKKLNKIFTELIKTIETNACASTGC